MKLALYQRLPLSSTFVETFTFTYLILIPTLKDVIFEIIEFLSDSVVILQLLR